MLSWGHFAASSKQTEKSSGHALLLKQQSLLLSLSPDHSSSQSGQLISHLPIRGSFLECGRPSRAQSWQELGTTSWEMALLLSGCLWCGAFFLSSAVSCFICCRPGERQGHCSMMPNAGRRNHTMALACCLPKWVRWHMWVPWRLRVPAGPEEALLTWPLLLCGASCISSPSFRITTPSSLCIPAQDQPHQPTPTGQMQRRLWLTMALRRRMLGVPLRICVPRAPRAVCLQLSTGRPLLSAGDSSARWLLPSGIGSSFCCNLH